MGSPAKASTILFLTAFIAFTTTVAQEVKKTQIGNPVSVTVPYQGKVAVPVQFVSQDYTGPYDPADPKGIAAATRRQMKIQSQKTAEVVKSYIPPGMDNFAKKQLIHLAISEGKRFAFAHPKETAELVGIATKVKGLVHSAENKIKKADEVDKKHDRH